MGASGLQIPTRPHTEPVEGSMCWNDDNSYSEPLVSSLAFNMVIDRYLDHLQSEGIDEPLSQQFTLSTVLADLYDLAEVRPPAEIAAVVG
jgi:hypothetical protein